MLSDTVKRTLDLAVTIITLPIWIPTMFILACLVRLKMGTPIFFCQQRPGLNGLPFTLIKFRTMSEASTEHPAFLDEDRLTSFGRWLRSTSFDELPELLSVVKGDMSLVGPRPLLVRYLPRYSPRQARRHEVKPGITGWAQINGRNAISWEEKLEMDVWYVENQSLGLDLKILFLTLFKVFQREGINAPGSATAPEFLGSNPDR